ncbi:unnamed protein product [Prunus armeniaca]
MYLPLSCKDEEFHPILVTMFVHGAIKLLRPSKVPTKEKKGDPRYCRYHKFVGHPTTACQTLRKILYSEIHDETLELPLRKQAFDENPLTKQRGKEMVVVMTCFDDLLDDNILYHLWKNDPKPSKAIWEPCGNMEKAY